MYCQDVDAYRQDAQALHDAFQRAELITRRVLPEKIQLQIPPLNHTYT